MGARNRTAGHGFERSICKRINSLTLNDTNITAERIKTTDDSSFYTLPKVCTTREVDRASDAKKKDITTFNKKREQEFPYIIQAKSRALSTVSYERLLQEIVDNNTEDVTVNKRIPVVFHQRTAKANKRFIVKGEYAIMYMEDFLKLIDLVGSLKFELKQREVIEVNKNYNPEKDI